MRKKLIELLGNLYCGDIGIDGCDSCEYGCETECTAKAFADHLIDNGVTIQKWIPVSERLPQRMGEICKTVILLMDDGVVTTGWLNEDRGSGYYLPPRDDFISKVPLSRFTHWMPLPEPPKGE